MPIKEDDTFAWDGHYSDPVDPDGSVDWWITGKFLPGGTAAGTWRIKVGKCDTDVLNWTAVVTSIVTPSPTPVPTPSPTPTSTPTATPEPTPTETLVASLTPTSTGTPASSPAPTTPPPVSTPTPAPTPTPIPEESVAGVVEAGGTLTTDPEGHGATGAHPVQTWVTSPSAGTVTIDEKAISGVPPPGFRFLGQSVTITAPNATAANPLVIRIAIDASLVPPGQTNDTIRMYKNGSEVPACAGAPGVASPDPCVSARELLTGGDIQITVLTSSASDWNLGTVVNGNVDCDGDMDSVDALYLLRWVAQLGPYAACVLAAGDVNCNGELDAVDALGILRSVAGLPPLPAVPGCPAIGSAGAASVGGAASAPVAVGLAGLGLMAAEVAFVGSRRFRL